MGSIFLNVDRGKRSVLLDLRRDEDKAKLRTLIESADVFIHSMRGKAIANLGFVMPPFLRSTIDHLHQF